MEGPVFSSNVIVENVFFFHHSVLEPWVECLVITQIAVAWLIAKRDLEQKLREKVVERAFVRNTGGGV